MGAPVLYTELFLSYTLTLSIALLLVTSLSQRIVRYLMKCFQKSTHWDIAKIMLSSINGYVYHSVKCWIYNAISVNIDKL